MRWVISLLIIVLPIFIYAQEVSNIQATQQAKNVIITYDLSGEDKYEVEIFFTIDDGKTWQGPLKQVTGNVGKKQVEGFNKQIIWDVLAEGKEISTYIQFKVVATNKHVYERQEVKHVYERAVPVRSLIAKSENVFTDSRDGHRYKTVKIGTQIWMAENLAYLPSVSRPKVKSITKPYYYIYGYSGKSVRAAKATSNYATYGVLYNWIAAKLACPSRWHLPTVAEWIKLENALTGTDKMSQLAGNTSLWYSGDLKNSSQFGMSGFSALPGGLRHARSSFGSVGLNGHWWSATESESSYAWSRGMRYNRSDVRRGNDTKANGFSVRCIRD